MFKTSKDPFIQTLLTVTLLVTLVILCYSIIEFFIIPALWAAIIAYMTFPVYTFFHTKVKFSPDMSATLMLMALLLTFGVPFVIGFLTLQQEALNLYDTLLNRIKYGAVIVPKEIADLPIIGQQITDTIIEINKNSEETILQIQNWIQSHLYYGKIAVDAIVGGLAKFGMIFLTLFFFYRDGAVLVTQIRQALRKVIGNRIDSYINSVGETTQAVVYGIGLTAVAQALLSGVGYYFSGAPNPLFLTLITFMISLIPFGTPFVWSAVALWLFSQGQTTEAIGLALWGAVVVSWVDNLIRPIVISGATKIPFFIILIGVLGGLSAFGFIGLFIGPVILGIALAVWREWISQHIEIEE